MANLPAVEHKHRTDIRRILRCRRSSRYFTGVGWDEDPEKAKHFPDEMEAVRACVEHGLEDVDLVLRASQGQTDLFCTSIR